MDTARFATQTGDLRLLFAAIIRATVVVNQAYVLERKKQQEMQIQMHQKSLCSPRRRNKTIPWLVALAVLFGVWTLWPNAIPAEVIKS